MSDVLGLIPVWLIITPLIGVVNGALFFLIVGRRASSLPLYLVLAVAAASLVEASGLVPSGEPPFSLVVLCTGNQIRSPAVEGFVRQYAASLPLVVSSAGMLDTSATTAYPAAVEAAARLGLDLSAHRTRHVSDLRLDKADLVVGFERGHVARAVVDGSSRNERTFTLPELIELLELLPPSQEIRPLDRARGAVAAADELRGRGVGFPAGEVADPIGRRTKDVRETVSLLRELSKRLVNGLFGVDPSR